MQPPANHPPMIRTDESNAFAQDTMRRRVPNIIREVQALNPDYSSSIHAALSRLSAEIEANEPMRMIDVPAPDYDDWAAAYAPHAGETWQGAEWFFAEVFFYRHLMQAIRWWETGRDPFAQKKRDEIESAALWDTLDLALNIERGPLESSLIALLDFALWGNRIDLSFAASLSRGGTWEDDDLISDDRARAVEHLLTGSGPVHIVADNFGTELAMDLVLLDELLTRDVVPQATIHVKLHPTFVSDTTVPDVYTFLHVLDEHGARPAALASRLRTALEVGRLRLAPDWFWNSPYLLWQIPPRLQRTFEDAR
ncbi:MAG: DUF89 family protein, partial [Burkholderiales bacterium]|nr:DUF89 family protein [Anaerolineae bacterium]